jgi:hypothetical protein
LVKLNITIDQSSPSCQLLDVFWERGVFYVAEMRCSSSLGLSASRVVEKEHLFSHIRTKLQKDRPYLLGKLISIDTVKIDDVSMKQITVMFNSDHSAWHYGWVSHKHACNTPHLVDVMVLVESTIIGSQFVIAASYLSPEFVVSSTKNSRGQRSSPRIDYSSDETDKDESLKK